MTVIPQPFFPAYGGLAPAMQGPITPNWVIQRPAGSGLAPIEGPGQPAWVLLRPRLVPRGTTRGVSDVMGITPTQHPELYGRVDQLYLRRPFGLNRASLPETQALGQEVNQMLRPGGFVEFRLTTSDVLAPNQLQTIQAQLPGARTVVVDRAAIDAFRSSGTVPADVTQAEMLRNAEADIRQSFDPLGLARMAEIIRIYKPAAP